MIIFPAIDLLDGQVVRLEQGKRENCTIYSADPVAVARSWQEQGAQALHIVDLDGAFTGEPKNLIHIQNITRALSIPVQLGGGMRTAENVAAALEAGVARVILGTKAGESLPFVEGLVRQFGGEKIAVGIDARDGLVSVKGWTESTTLRAVDLAQEVEGLGVHTIIYTDIATDGMFTGPNFPALRELLEVVKARVIASGGVGTAEHVHQLRALGTVYGAIVGKALYDQKVQLSEIL
jgi:phosphoribosylformimino-5-aminoimidazole carboxamide ribotide isomerase